MYYKSIEFCCLDKLNDLLDGGDGVVSDKITTTDIAAAEKLLGIEYTSAERELMVGNLDKQVRAAQAQRALNFPNSLTPATRFDPRLPGFKGPQQQKPFCTLGL